MYTTTSTGLELPTHYELIQLRNRIKKSEVTNNVLLEFYKKEKGEHGFYFMVENKTGINRLNSLYRMYNKRMKEQ